MEIVLLAAEPTSAWTIMSILIIAAVVLGLIMMGVTVAAVVAMLVGRSASN